MSSTRHLPTTPSPLGKSRISATQKGLVREEEAYFVDGFGYVTQSSLMNLRQVDYPNYIKLSAEFKRQKEACKTSILLPSMPIGKQLPTPPASPIRSPRPLPTPPSSPLGQVKPIAPTTRQQYPAACLLPLLNGEPIAKPAQAVKERKRKALDDDEGLKRKNAMVKRASNLCNFRYSPIQVVAKFNAIAVDA